MPVAMSQHGGRRAVPGSAAGCPVASRPDGLAGLRPLEPGWIPRRHAVSGWPAGQGSDPGHLLQPLGPGTKSAHEHMKAWWAEVSPGEIHGPSSSPALCSLGTSPTS